MFGYPTGDPAARPAPKGAGALRRCALTLLFAVAAGVVWAQPYEPRADFYADTAIYADLTPSMAVRLELFCHDLCAHDYYRIFAYFDPWYVGDQMYMAGTDAPDPARDPEEAATFIFLSSAIMYEGGSEPIGEISDIREVTVTEILLDQVYFRAVLADERVVDFSLFMDRDTYLFSGAVG